METFILNFLDLLDEEPDFKINQDTFFKEVPGWDSLTALSFIAMVSNKYGKAIDGEILRTCDTLREVYEVVVA